MGRVICSILNPLNIVEVEPMQIPQYLSRHMDDYFLSNRLTRWQQLGYFQPYIQNDTLYLQLLNNAGAISVDVIDCNETVVYTFSITQKQQNAYDPNFYIYESDTALNVLQPGKYWLLIKVGSGPNVLLTAEGFEIGDGQDTLLLQYSNRKFFANMIFETGYVGNIRIHGRLRLGESGSKDTTYEDQELDVTIIKSQPFVVYELLIDPIPDWMYKKLLYALGCSDLQIDGKYFAKSPEAKFEVTSELDNGTLKSYKIELRENVARNAKIFDSIGNENERLIVTYITDLKGFGDLDGGQGDNLIPVTDYE